MRMLLREERMASLWTLRHHGPDWRQGSSELPSWVVDWRTPPCILGSRAFAPQDHRTMPRLRAHPQASGVQLEVYGVPLSTVQEVAAEDPVTHISFWSRVGRVMSQNGHGWETEETTFWQQLEKVAMFWQYSTPLEGRGSDNPLALSHALHFAKMICDCLPAIDILKEDYHAMYVTISRFRQIRKLVLSSPKLAVALNETLRAFIETIHSAAALESEEARAACDDEGVLFSPTLRGLSAFWQSCRLYNTTTGHLGLGPEVIQPRDTVAIVASCDYPVILRPCGNFHYFVGHAYYTGVRRYEILEVWVSPEERLQKFVLR